MIIKCPDCSKYFEDVFRSTECPHAAFDANDGENNFSVHEESYLSEGEPPEGRIFEAH